MMPMNDPIRDIEAFAVRLALLALTLIAAVGLVRHEWHELIGGVSLKQEIVGVLVGALSFGVAIWIRR